MDALFGEMPLLLKFFIAFLIVLALIGGSAYLVRRYGRGALTAASARNRQRRLAVIDAASIDGRRRLVLIRRDNVEHLIMVGGPTDIVIEPNIVRASPAAIPTREAPVREPAPTSSRTSGAADALQRAMQGVETSAWPQQAEVSIRAPRVAPQADEVLPWPPTPQPEHSPRPQHAERLSGIAVELARPQGVAQSTATVRSASPDVRQMPVPEALSDEQNLAEMAHRLETALRRPVTETTSPSLLKPVAVSQSRQEVMPGAGPSRTVSEIGKTFTDSKVSLTPDSKPARPAYDSLEHEMASLLGRTSGKT